jgi:hypothetical protein
VETVVEWFQAGKASLSFILERPGQEGQSLGVEGGRCLFQGVGDMVEGILLDGGHFQAFVYSGNGTADLQ